MQQNHILWEVQIPLIRYPPGLNMPLSEMMEEDEAFSGHKLSELIRRQRAAPPSASLQEGWRSNAARGHASGAGAEEPGEQERRGL